MSACVADKLEFERVEQEQSGLLGLRVLKEGCARCDGKQRGGKKPHKKPRYFGDEWQVRFFLAVSLEFFW